MSIYNFTPAHEAVFQRFISSIDDGMTTVPIPVSTVNDTHELLRKALSASRYGYAYDPTKLQISKSLLSASVQFRNILYPDTRIIRHPSIERELDRIVTAAKRHHSVYDQILYVYRYFVENFQYVQSSVDRPEYHSASHPFLHREAVCDGFSLAFSIALNRLGIPCGIISGSGIRNGAYVSHTWNIAQIEGVFYHLDVTWDICIKNKGAQFFDYFCCDDTVFLRDHRWADSSIPYCRDSSLDYYQRFGAVVNSQNLFVSELRKRIAGRQSLISIRFTKIDSAFFSSSKPLAICKTELQRLNVAATIKFYSNPAGGTAIFMIQY